MENISLLTYTSSIIASSVFLFIFYLLFLVFQPFLTALILSAVIVLLFYPVHIRIKRKMPNGLASSLSTLLVFMIIIVPGLLISISILYEAIDLSQSTNLSIEKIIRYLHTIGARVGIDSDKLIKDTTQKIASQAGQLVAYIIGNTWNIFMNLLMIVLATFFFFRDGEKIVKAIESLTLNSTWFENLIQEIVTMIKSNIAASFIAASIQGVIGGLTFAYLGLPTPILWGTVMGFFSLFPFIGSWLIWIPTAITLGLAGQWWDAILLIIIGIVVVNPVDNILRPAIVASATHLNGLLIFIGLLGGVQAFGISGLLLGPVLVIFVASLLKSSPKYLKKVF